jgi:hypothetical protein
MFPATRLGKSRATRAACHSPTRRLRFAVSCLLQKHIACHTRMSLCFGPLRPRTYVDCAALRWRFGLGGGLRRASIYGILRIAVTENMIYARAFRSMFSPDLSMVSHTAEEKIRALVARAIDTSDPSELEALMGELRDALKHHIHQTKAMVVSSWPSISSRSRE